jgi:hypothetical protein
VSEPAPRHQSSHIYLVTVVAMMIPMVAVVAVPIVVRAPVVIAVVSMRPIVSIWIITVSIRRIVTIPIARITDPDSH